MGSSGMECPAGAGKHFVGWLGQAFGYVDVRVDASKFSTTSQYDRNAFVSTGMDWEAFLSSLKYDFDLLPQDVSINVPHVLYQLLYMIRKTRVYICACIDACVCMCVCVSVCVSVC